MANIKTFLDIINDEQYNQLMNVVKKGGKYISETGILDEMERIYQNKTHKVNIRKKLKRLVKENLLLTKTKRNVARDIQYNPNPKFSRDDIMDFAFADYAPKKKRYYYFPKYTNELVIRLRKLYCEVESHNGYVSKKDMDEINEKISNFSARFSLLEWMYPLAKYNLKEQKLLEHKEIGAVISEKIKFTSNNEAVSKYINEFINRDIVMKFIFKLNEDNQKMVKLAFRDISDIFLILHQYYNDQHLATKHFS